MELGLSAGRALVRVVLARLAMSAQAVTDLSVLQPEALVQGPGLDQRPSTEKWSSDSNGLTFSCLNSVAMNFWNTSPCCKRSRLFAGGFPSGE